MLFLLVAVAGAVIPEGYVPVPDGYFLHETCIFHHPDGQIDPNVEYACTYPGIPVENEQIYRMDTHLGDSSTRQTSFNATFTAPSLPSSAGGQVVYFWPGFKQSQPEMGYPVFQPVLQYGQAGPQWQLQSWFVWGNKGIAHTGPAVSVAGGDELVTYMDGTNAKSWVCYGINNKSKKASLLTQTPTQMGGTSYYEYAMFVLETISVNTCAQLPKGDSVAFTDVLVNGKAATWTPRVTRSNCGEAIKTSTDSVTMSWHN